MKIDKTIQQFLKEFGLHIKKYIQFQLSNYNIIKMTSLKRHLKWGGRWDSNPRISEPQSEVLTA